MAAVYPNMLQDKLTNEIFSILENKFLFGTNNDNGKVRILSMDAGDAILAANALVHLQSILRAKSGNPAAHIADFFDVVAGSGAGGVLAALLFTRGKDGAPLMTAEQSLSFLLDHHRSFGRRRRQLFGRRSAASKLLKKVFGELSLKDTLRKGVLIPCYDLKSGAPFLFSRADALEMDGCDFRIAGLCEATLAESAVELRSVDGRSRIAAVGGRVGMSNPTAAAITHVLNNKHEFPLCASIQDILVVSLGGGGGGAADVAAQGFSEMVDQAVSMAFGEERRSNYVRIEGVVNGEKKRARAVAERILGEKNVESVLFKGKKMVEATNMERMEMLGGELIKEQERRKNAILPTVLLTSPRSSSASTLSSN